MKPLFGLSEVCAQNSPESFCSFVKKTIGSINPSRDQINCLSSTGTLTKLHKGGDVNTNKDSQDPIKCQVQLLNIKICPISWQGLFQSLTRILRVVSHLVFLVPKLFAKNDQYKCQQGSELQLAADLQLMGFVWAPFWQHRPALCVCQAMEKIQALKTL